MCSLERRVVRSCTWSLPKLFALVKPWQDDFKAYGQAVVDNAKVLAETLMANGLPLVSGGTENHLMLVDVTAAGLGGKKAEAVLDNCGITVNMNMIPFDTRKPMDPSGIRIGTPALTTRGMGPEEMKRVGDVWIHQALNNSDDAAYASKRFVVKSVTCARTFLLPRVEWRPLQHADFDQLFQIV